MKFKLPVAPENEFESNKHNRVFGDSLNYSDVFNRLHGTLLDEKARISTRPSHDATFPSDASIRGRPSSTERLRSRDEISFD